MYHDSQYCNGTLRFQIRNVQYSDTEEIKYRGIPQTVGSNWYLMSLGTDLEIVTISTNEHGPITIPANTWVPLGSSNTCTMILSIVIQYSDTEEIKYRGIPQTVGSNWYLMSLGP
jgi:hypothetical protein